LPNEFCKRAFAPVAQSFYFWRLDQGWTLFAPRVRDINWHLTAVITLKNGLRMVYEPTQSQTCGFFERLRNLRHRDFTHIICWNEHSNFWPDYAKWIAGRYYSAQNPPVSLTMCNSWVEVPEPEGKVSIPRDHLPTHSKFYFLFYYRFKDGDLGNHALFP
ncbi:MAG TPA: hypothetical protein V6C72_05050, partial [Chroococcales cyanobacterium]